MPTRVHAVLVARSDVPAAADHLRRTLQALAAQTRPVDALTIVLCEPDAASRELAASSGAEGVVSASNTLGYAAALRAAGPRLSGDAVWLLAQDTAPAPDALDRLAGALEVAGSVAVAAPKLVEWNDTGRIRSLGVTMTRFGRAVERVEGERDQGQHDRDDDVLGADVRGLLVRSEAWRELDGLDPALGGADEGLDLGVRARLAGHRVVVVPDARIAVAGDGVAGLPEPGTRARRRRIAYATRAAQLHRRLAYAPGWAVPLHWLTLLPLAVWRTAALLVAKQPSRVLPEWGAALIVLVRWGAVGRARRRIRSVRRATWTSLAPLRIRRSELRERIDEDGDADAALPPVREELGFFTGGGAWVVLGALVASAALLPSLLAWPVLGGGGLAPLPGTIAQLWADAAYGLRTDGWDAVTVADPFAAVIAVLGTLWPADPSRMLVALWLAAAPLAALGGWFAATRLTNRPLLRNAAAVLWAAAPMLWSALADGRPAAVLVHLLLPWLFYAGVVAHRSWSAAGAASVLLAAVVACAPSLAPALAILWALAVILTVVARSGRGVGHVVWLAIPALALALPLVAAQLRARNPWGLLADPGPVVTAAQASADADGRLGMLAGFPGPGAGGWDLLLGGTGVPALAMTLLALPLVAIALAALATPRWMVAAVPWATALLGWGTAFAAVSVQVAATPAGSPVALLPGPGLSLAWLGVCAAAVIALDAGLGGRAVRAQAAVTAVMMTTAVALAVPALTASVRGTAVVTASSPATLPAYVAAQARSGDPVGTLVVTVLGDREVAARVVWGGTDTLLGRPTVRSSALEPLAGDREMGQVAVDLISSTDPAALTRAAGHGIGYVVLAPAPDDRADVARAPRSAAAASLDQRAGLEAVGDTPKGSLWRVLGEVAPRPAAPPAIAGWAALIGVIQAAVVVAALLLAVPTAASRRQARRVSRIVGPRPREDA